ncbi:hypothetical protein NDU88_007167 [Pleurodeles waltl]|uniref:Uncharacterized protein n=1 Tax=Pleurodeles waltl TaxID=8319 RepID=A0AAV7MEF5_PLEWA|nr:hypothetical protein NDU88_007167 [Pleurodeles waltl]
MRWGALQERVEEGSELHEVGSTTGESREEGSESHEVGSTTGESREEGSELHEVGALQERVEEGSESHEVAVRSSNNIIKNTAAAGAAANQMSVITSPRVLAGRRAFFGAERVS